MNATAEVLKPMPRPPAKKPAGFIHSALALHKAQSYAAKIGEWIGPHCRQIEAVGEIRRRCSTCATIDLLVVPRFEANSNRLFAFLDDYVQNEKMSLPYWLHSSGDPDLRGLPPGHYDHSATLVLPKCRLVLHTATPENWFLRLFESTGSPAHLATIMQRVRSLPGTWEPGEAIKVRSKPIKLLTEGHIYDVLNMSLVVPWKRAE